MEFYAVAVALHRPVNGRSIPSPSSLDQKPDGLDFLLPLEPVVGELLQPSASAAKLANARSRINCSVRVAMLQELLLLFQ